MVTCGHLLLFNAFTGSTSSQLRLTRLIAGYSPMSLTTGAVQLVSELNNCSVNQYNSAVNKTTHPMCLVKFHDRVKESKCLRMIW